MKHQRWYLITDFITLQSINRFNISFYFQNVWSVNTNKQQHFALNELQSWKKFIYLDCGFIYILKYPHPTSELHKSEEVLFLCQIWLLMCFVGSSERTAIIRDLSRSQWWIQRLISLLSWWISSKMSAMIYHATWHHIPEDNNLQDINHFIITKREAWNVFSF
jgi:hypothetical protein